MPVSEEDLRIYYRRRLEMFCGKKRFNRLFLPLELLSSRTLQELYLQELVHANLLSECHYRTLSYLALTSPWL